MPAPSFEQIRARLRSSGLRTRIFRYIGIGVLLFLVGACAVVFAAYVWQLQVALAAAAGLLAMAGAFYLFIHLWPDDLGRSDLPLPSEKPRQAPKPKPLSPQEYRRQREQAQRLIREKAAPALARAIRGILRQDEAEQRSRRRRPRR